MRFRVLVNPAAGSGRAGRRLVELEAALGARAVPFDVARTERPGHATELARRARADGVEALIVVGGDGTLNEVAQAYVSADGRAEPGPALALVPGGTGGDFRKTLGLGDAVAPAVERLLASKGRPLDLGLLRVTSDDGELVTRAFLNIASFGIGGLTDRIVNESPKWMGGRLAFFTGTLRAMFRYRNQPVRVLVDGAPFLEGPIVNVALANGRYFGGGMHIAPEAELGDGQLDVVALGDLGPRALLGLTRRLYAGRHLGLPKVTSTRGRLVRAEPLGPEPVLVDLDGETPGRLPIEADLAPGALRLLA